MFVLHLFVCKEVGLHHTLGKRLVHQHRCCSCHIYKRNKSHRCWICEATGRKVWKWEQNEDLALHIPLRCLTLAVCSRNHEASRTAQLSPPSHKLLVPVCVSNITIRELLLSLSLTDLNRQDNTRPQPSDLSQAAGAILVFESENLFSPNNTDIKLPAYATWADLLFKVPTADVLIGHYMSSATHTHELVMRLRQMIRPSLMMAGVNTGEHEAHWF